MSSPSTYLVYSQCALGLEALLRAELVDMGVDARVVLGGVEFRGGMQEVARVCACSRLSESVRVRLKEFRAKDFDALSVGVRKLPFRAFLGAGAFYRLKVSCQKSKLWHSGAVAQRVARVLEEHVGWVPAGDTENENAQGVSVRVLDDVVQVSVDAGGARMHRRGYRTHVEKASLRETLAAALLTSVESCSNGARPEMIWDPFCGAGTILLEALHRDSCRVARERTRGAFENWRSHDPDEFRSWKEEWRGSPGGTLRVLGSDCCTSAIEASRVNSRELGLGERAQFFVGDIEQIEPQIPEGSWVVTNPPYGKRIGDTEAVQKLLRVLAKRADLKPAACLIGGSAREKIPKDRPSLFNTKNGGLAVSCRLLRS